MSTPMPRRETNRTVGSASSTSCVIGGPLHDQRLGPGRGVDDIGRAATGVAPDVVPGRLEDLLLDAGAEVGVGDHDEAHRMIQPWALQPPSMRSVVPVTNDPSSSLARYSTARAISSGSPKRCSGVRAM